VKHQEKQRVRINKQQDIQSINKSMQLRNVKELYNVNNGKTVKKHQMNRIKKTKNKIRLTYT
jgi:hypothetical protein